MAGLVSSGVVRECQRLLPTFECTKIHFNALFIAVCGKKGTTLSSFRIHTCLLSINVRVWLNKYLSNCCSVLAKLSLEDNVYGFKWETDIEDNEYITNYKCYERAALWTWLKKSHKILLKQNWKYFILFWRNSTVVKLRLKTLMTSKLQK